MSEVAFLEPLEEEGQPSEEDEELDLSKQPDDGEGANDPEVQKRMDDENMAVATDKILKKMKKDADKGDGQKLLLDSIPITPQAFASIDKRT